MSQNLSSAAVVIGALRAKAQITTKVICFCPLINVFEASVTNTVDPDQTDLGP